MEEDKILPEEGENIETSEPEKMKTPLQVKKEGWYDKIPLNVKQLDIIITVCWILIAVVFVVIALDAMDIFNPFGY